MKIRRGVIAAAFAAAGLVGAVASPASAAIPSGDFYLQHATLGDCYDMNSGSVYASVCDGGSDVKWQIASSGSWYKLWRPAENRCLTVGVAQTPRGLTCAGANSQKFELIQSVSSPQNYRI